MKPLPRTATRPEVRTQEEELRRLRLAVKVFPWILDRDCERSRRAFQLLEVDAILEGRCAATVSQVDREKLETLAGVRPVRSASPCEEVS